MSTTEAAAVLGAHFIKLGAVEEILKVLRGVETTTEFELQSAGVCALSSLCLHDMGTNTSSPFLTV